MCQANALKLMDLATVVDTCDATQKEAQALLILEMAKGVTRPEKRFRRLFVDLNLHASQLIPQYKHRVLVRRRHGAIAVHVR